jgi:hypothetical protein
MTDRAADRSAAVLPVRAVVRAHRKAAARSSAVVPPLPAAASVVATAAWASGVSAPTSSSAQRRARSKCAESTGAECQTDAAAVATASRSHDSRVDSATSGKLRPVAGVRASQDFAQGRGLAWDSALSLEGVLFREAQRAVGSVVDKRAYGCAYRLASGRLRLGSVRRSDESLDLQPLSAVIGSLRLVRLDF